MVQGVPKKVGFTATIISSKSHFFGGHLVVVCIWSSDLVDPLSLVFFGLTQMKLDMICF